jgi:hypothetical protein
VTGALVAGLLPERVMYTQWFAALSMFVAVNTVLYLTLAIIKLLPKAYMSDWVNHRNRRSETRSIYPEGAVDLVPAHRVLRLPVHDQAVNHRRLALLEQSEQSGNVSEGSWAEGVSRTRHYERNRPADRYGTEALKAMDRARRLPKVTPTHVVEQLVSLAALVEQLPSPAVLEGDVIQLLAEQAQIVGGLLDLVGAHRPGESRGKDERARS